MCTWHVTRVPALPRVSASVVRWGESRPSPDRHRSLSLHSRQAAMLTRKPFNTASHSQAQPLCVAAEQQTTGKHWQVGPRHPAEKWLDISTDSGYIYWLWIYLLTLDISTDTGYIYWIYLLTLYLVTLELSACIYLARCTRRWNHCSVSVEGVRGHLTLSPCGYKEGTLMVGRCAVSRC